MEVAPARLERWLRGFTERHGPAEADTVGDTVGDTIGPAVRLLAPDGTRATVCSAVGAPAPVDLADLVAQACRPRRIALLLARRAAVALGVADGDRLVVSKVDTSYVQGRTAAGGWSQQRFARRRANQARSAASGAADLAASLLLPRMAELSALVTGGDRVAVAAVLADARLAPLARLRSERFLDVGEPRLAVLEAALVRARAVLIRVVEPE